jgi:hypothetical protein
MTQLPSSSNERARKSGNRYAYDLKRAARDMRERGMSCPEIARELNVSLRSAQVWTMGIEAALRRTCWHCHREFEQPADSGGVNRYCSEMCARYAYAERRRPRRKAA